MTHFNVKCKTIKFLGKTVKENFQDLGISEEFLDLIPKTLSIKRKIYKLDLINIQSFCSVEDHLKKMKKQITD